MSAADLKMLEELEAAMTKALGSNLRARIVNGERYLTIEVREASFECLIDLARKGLAVGGDVTVSSTAPVRHRDFAHTPRCTTGECRD